MLTKGKINENRDRSCVIFIVFCLKFSFDINICDTFWISVIYIYTHTHVFVHTFIFTIYVVLYIFLI